MKDGTIAIVLHPHEKQVLWVKRRDLPIWVLPGGGIDWGESPENAALREVEEESGLKVSIHRKCARYTPINRFTAVTHTYLCHIEAGSMHPTEESAEVGFFPIDSPPSPHFPLHLDWLKEAFSNPHVLIERPIDTFTWKRVGYFFCKHPFILIRYLFTSLFLQRD